MRMLCLLVLTTLFAIPCFAQSYQFNNGDTWYCKVSGKVQHTAFSRQEDRTYKITVTSRQKTGNYFLDITLLNLQVTDVQGGRKTIFDTDNLHTWEYNDSRLYDNLALLQQVVRITLNKNGSLLEIWNLDALKIKGARKWHLSKSMEEILAYNIGTGLQASLQSLFPPLPVQQETGFSWQQDNITYTVTKENPDNISIRGNAVHKGMTTFASTPQAELRPYVSSTEINYVAGKHMSMLQHYQSSLVMRNDPAREEKGRADSMHWNTVITGQTAPLTAPVLNWDYINTLIYLSYQSDSLKGADGREMDSAKIVRFFQVNDPKYAGDSTYRMRKLDKLNNMRSPYFRKWYDQLLATTPINSLAGSSMHLHNKLQDAQHENKDTALAIMKALHNQGRLVDWVHDSYAQEFEKKDHPMADAILQLAMKEKDSLLLATLRPLHLWSLAQQANGDKKQLQAVADAFAASGKAALWYGRSGRYAMLTCQLMEKAGMSAAAARLLDQEITRLKADQADTTAQRLRDTRIINKQLLAHAYKLKYDHAWPRDKKAALGYLVQAAAYAPQHENEKAYASFYDRAVLRAKEDYREDLASALTDYGNPEEALQVMTAQLQTAPLRIKDVAAFFRQHFPNKSFNDYLHKVILKGWTTAPDFALKNLEDKQVRLADYKGKWLLIDFWGTWCSPCRAEMPEVNALAKDIADGKYPNTAFLSIACHDEQNTVRQFMEAHHYTMPVLLSDNKVQGNYKINGYPTKVLISPEGKMVPVAFGQDYKAILESFATIAEDPVAGKAMKTQVKTTNN